MTESYRKLIIIGAPRSGTNMLRDALCALPGFATFPCDEINPVWKHGHLLSFLHDDLKPQHASEQLAAFVRRRFDWLARRSGAHVVVEKTCANSVRVAYMRALLPEAEFLFIHRNGADAVASGIKRWSSSVNLAYTLRKVRFVPPIDLPVYGWRFFRNRLKQRVDAQRRLPTWGPMTDAVANAAAKGDIARAAACQWRDCVDMSLDELPEQRIQVSYEDFVHEPVARLVSVLTALDISVKESAIALAAAPVRSDKMGQGLADLNKAGQRKLVAEVINDTLERLGYESI